MMGNILQRLQDDVFRILLDRMLNTKRHASNTELKLLLNEVILEGEQVAEKAGIRASPSYNGGHAWIQSLKHFIE